MVDSPEKRERYKVKRSHLLKRMNALKTEREPWLSHCRDVATHLLPKAGKFFFNDRKRHDRTAWNSIIDNAGTLAHRVMRAGMMAGATSPARPWFKLAPEDPDLADYRPAALWLDTAVTQMQRVFNKSNTYRMFHQSYGELGGFGTAADIVVPNRERVIHHHALTVGEYMIQQDYEERVNTLYRELTMTVAQLVQEFGYDACSLTVQRMWKEGDLDHCVPIVHVIEKRSDRDVTKSDNLNMPFASVYFELGGDKDEDKVLRESGFKRFPALTPRWDVYGADLYGVSPGMEALGDIKQLQVEQLRKGQGIDYQSKPPIYAPTSMKDSDINLLPGGVTFGDAASPNGGVRTMFEPKLQLDHLLLDIQDVRRRIDRAFYADLWLMIHNASDTTQRTAYELAVRQEEKMIMLGPVLERLFDELLEPLIDITFEHMLESGMLPPPPPELLGMDLNVEFVSVLAQAQKAIGTNSIDRYVGTLATVAAVPGLEDVVDNFDKDAWARRYGSMLGLPTELMRDEAKVNQLRDARSKQQAATAMAEQAEMQGKATKSFAEAGSTMQDLTGYGTGEQP